MHIKDDLELKRQVVETSEFGDDTAHAHGDAVCVFEGDCAGDKGAECVADAGDETSKHRGKPLQEKSFVPPESRGVSLGREAEAEIEHTMSKRYKRFLKLDESIQVETEVCHQFARVKVNINNPSRTTHLEIDAYLECEPNGFNNPIEAYHIVLDILDLSLLDYFESDRISHYLPIWQSYEHEAKTVHIRLEHANLALEDEASAFLRAHGFDDGGELLGELLEEGVESLD